MTEKKELSAQEKFEQKLYHRLRDDVAELLPDDVLSEMANRAIEKMFFEPRHIQKKDGWREETVKLPSWFEERVERLMRERMDLFAKQWMTANADKLAKSFTTTMAAVMPAIIAQSIFKPVESAIQSSEYQMANRISEYMQQQFGNALPMTTV